MAWLGLGKQKEDHKYVARVNEGSSSKPKYRYFYSNAAYNAYLKVQDAKKAVNSLSKDISKSVNTAATKVSSSVSKAATSAKTSAKNFVSSVKSSPVVQSGKNFVSTVSQKVSEATTKAVASGKNFVERSSEKLSYTKATQDYYDNYFQNMFGF